MWKRCPWYLLLNRDWRAFHSEQLVTRCYDELKYLTGEHNSSAPSNLQISLPEPTQLNSPKRGKVVHRLLVSTPFWASIIRVTDGEADFFLFPAIELTDYQRGESISNRKFHLVLDQRSGAAATWLLGTSAIGAGELSPLLKALLSDLIKKSRADMDLIPESVQSGLKDFSITGVITALMAEKHRLVANLAGERESVKAELAREIHDTVIGDVLYLRRSLSGAKRLSDEDMVKTLDGLYSRLRSICADLAPADITEWGLGLLLKDLAQRYHERTGTACLFEEDGDLPELPAVVALQTFRIVQECLNNCEKHSRALQVAIKCSTENDRLRIEIRDNGVGFDQDAVMRASPEQCKGAQIIRERAQLISAVLPASLSVRSGRGAGTVVALDISLTGLNG